MAALCTVNEAVKLRYNLKEGDEDQIHENDKQFIRANILDAIKVNIEQKGFKKTYKEILDKVIKVDFPHKYLDLIHMSISNLKNAASEKEVLAAMIPIQLLIGSYEMTLGQPREQLKALIPKIFPFLENYAMKFMNEMK